MFIYPSSVIISTAVSGMVGKVLYSLGCNCTPVLHRYKSYKISTASCARLPNQLRTNVSQNISSIGKHTTFTPPPTLRLEILKPRSHQLHTFFAKISSAMSQSSPNTLDLTTLPAQQLSALQQRLSQELEHLSTSYQRLRAAQSRFRDCIRSIQDGIQGKSGGMLSLFSRLFQSLSPKEHKVPFILSGKALDLVSSKTNRLFFRDDFRNTPPHPTDDLALRPRNARRAFSFSLSLLRDKRRNSNSNRARGCGYRFLRREVHVRRRQILQ